MGGGEDPYAARRAALAAALDAAALEEADTGEDALRYASWLSETLRQATFANGEARAVLAVHVRDDGNLSFAELGDMMGVSKARANDIYQKGLASLPKPEAPEAAPIVAAVVTSPLGVLISRRRDRNPLWSFVGGEIWPGEEPAAAAAREVRDETGLEVTGVQVIGSRIHPHTGRRMVYVAAEPVAGTSVRVADAAELAQVLWASLPEAEALMPTMFAPVRAFLARVLRP